MKLSRELWLKVEPLFATALEMEVSARDAWLAGLDATQPEAAPILRRMLETHERAERSREMETVPRLAASPGWSSAHAPGARIGPFELVRPLGHGGMGEVWLARQADGRIEREVALKLPALHQQGEVWRERFRRERDILASLEHPNIARLYDAGVTESGQPWLAMEFVAGLSLSDHLSSRSLSLPGRLALFRQVLAAVAHAHRHLVVHRDLKPANILIDGSGQVKLLDFGIAKLVDEAGAPDASGELTRLGGRVMTLRYAAPEQVAAGAITTATDIYSLGVILHEMVTGLAPYRAVREGRPLTDAMLLAEGATMPSRLALTEDAARQCGLASPRQLARLVSGDLDAIVLKAMRREPTDRYASVELFDEDIRRHLERRPVKARAGTWRYLAGRFAARHKLPLATAAAVLVTLLAGLVMAERERRVAVAEKARAERHFASVRKLANTFIFEVHAKIESLPGSLEAREMLVRTSLEYLDALAAEAGRDPALTYEIAAAYRNIGNIQGQAGAANKGDLAASIRNFEKSKGLFAELARANPDGLAVAREHRKLSYALARGYYLTMDPRWQAEIDETIRLSARIAASPGATPEDRSLLPLARLEKANLASIATGRNPGNEDEMKRAVAELEAIGREAPGQADLRENLAGAYLRIGKLLYHAGRTPQSVQEALLYLRKARAIRMELRAEAPGDGRRQAAEFEAVLELGRAQGVAGDLRGADRTMGEAVALSREIAARDPSNANLAADLVDVLGAAAEIAIQVDDQPRAIRLCREALALAARLPEEARKSWDVRIFVSNAKAALGYALVATAERPAGSPDRRLAMLLEARALLADAAAFIAAARAENRGAVPESYMKLFEATVKRCDEAIARLGAA